MYAARCATFCAAGCGVVTIRTSARGRNCAIDSAMSPVPGGMSTTRKSGSPQCTSVRNCSSALCSIGPRHTTGWSSRAKKPIEMSVTPLASGGTITSSMTVGRPVDPEHARHREAPHVGVDRGDLVTALRERDREVGGDRRLADTALARRDREHARAGVDERVGSRRRAAVALGGVRVAAAVQPRRERGAFLVGHDDEVDVDPGNAGRAR